MIELEKRDILNRQCERALLIGFVEDSRHSAEAHVIELEGLVHSMGIEAALSMLITLREPHPRWLLGRGKADEIASCIRAENIDLVVFDADISPAQQRNLEKTWKIAVIDRQEVILDIFADRAATHEAYLQVALARMQYSLPRLTRAWTHLSRQRGGARGNRGKGETQLETDRRLVLDKIAHLKRDLKKVKAQREVRRKRRLEGGIPLVSLVGYTNAGKSSLLNALSGSDVYVENKLFATLDTSTRRMELPGGRECLLTDTVGFIRKLPHGLVDAFRSTLEEAVLADVILLAADASSEELEEHLKVTNQVLSELGAGNKPRILVLNKTDAMSAEALSALCMRYPDGLAVSARTGAGLEELLEKLGRVLDSARTEVLLRLPQEAWNIRSRLHGEVSIINEEFREDGIWLRVRLNDEERSRLAAYIIS
ncbi:MAG: GTPase HflX [Spirochaeta sp. LUC14_002_19_P3]|nr:MAG: GTPase HflX [Spirochaeta sp. LUC14_002_19_P3]